MFATLFKHWNMKNIEITPNPNSKLKNQLKLEVLYDKLLGTEMKKFSMT